MNDIVEAVDAVTIHVTDIARSRRFYSEVLGLKELSYIEKASRAAFALPGTNVQLTMHVRAPGEGGRAAGTVSGIVFSHRDPVAACAEIRRRGGTITDEPQPFSNPFATGVRGAFADPDGNEFLIRRLDSPAR